MYRTETNSCGQSLTPGTRRRLLPGGAVYPLGASPALCWPAHQCKSLMQNKPTHPAGLLRVWVKRGSFPQKHSSVAPFLQPETKKKESLFGTNFLIHDPFLLKTPNQKVATCVKFKAPGWITVLAYLSLSQGTAGLSGAIVLRGSCAAQTRGSW